MIADISGSVAAFARFTLMLVYAIQNQFSKVRSFVFIDGIDEVTDYFRPTEDITEAIHRVNTEADVVWVDGHSEDRDDGTAIGKPGSHPELPGFWFKCHHGSCQDRTLADFMTWCREHGFQRSSAEEDFAALLRIAARDVAGEVHVDGDARVAGGAVEFGDARGLRDLLDEGVFAAAASDDEDLHDVSERTFEPTLG